MSRAAVLRLYRDYVRTGVPLVLIMVTILSVALAVTYRL